MSTVAGLTKGGVWKERGWVVDGEKGREGEREGEGGGGSLTFVCRLRSDAFLPPRIVDCASRSSTFPWPNSANQSTNVGNERRLRSGGEVTYFS